MNDNPTTASQKDKESIERLYEEHADKIAPRNPTTGEWTAESVGNFGCEDFYAAQAIASAHNAALAAERLRIWREAPNQLDVQEAVIKKLNLVAAEQLDVAVEALKWYAVATYPDDGSGRPPEAFQRKAKAALEKIGGKQ